MLPHVIFLYTALKKRNFDDTIINESERTEKGSKLVLAETENSPRNLKDVEIYKSQEQQHRKRCAAWRCTHALPIQSARPSRKQNFVYFCKKRGTYQHLFPQN